MKNFTVKSEGLKQNIKDFPVTPNGPKQNIKDFPVTFEELKQITKEFPTPFYLYDEKAIRENIHRLYKAFSWNTGFREYFAVKSAPNPFILKLFKEENCGVDCASLTELILADSCGFSGDDVMFTSNVTTREEFIKAKNLNAIINLDDYSHIEYLKDCAGIPELVCLRLNPDCTITYLDNVILDYKDHKFGFTKDKLKEGINLLKKNGTKRFGLHCQFGSHRREAKYFGENARLVFKKVVEICSKTGITLDFINLAGGIGIPYQKDSEPANIEAISSHIKAAYDEVLGAAGLTPLPLYLELGIFMMGPYGYFVSSVLHIKETVKTFLGLDASTNCFMSPLRYSNYYHITAAGKEKEEPNHIYDITGALCENRDKFAVDYHLPLMKPGDMLIFHSAGAYTYAHSHNFNGKLRPAELLLCTDGSVKRIRRAETPNDYFATLDIPIKYD